MSPIFSIKADITGSELKWVMARLLMGTILALAPVQASGLCARRDADQFEDLLEMPGLFGLFA
jgi:hypothetical protein